MQTQVVSLPAMTGRQRWSGLVGQRIGKDK
jgi:hypothetical protein